MDQNLVGVASELGVPEMLKGQVLVQFGLLALPTADVLDVIQRKKILLLQMLMWVAGALLQPIWPIGKLNEFAGT